MVSRGWVQPALLLTLALTVSAADVIFKIPKIEVVQESVARPVGAPSSNSSANGTSARSGQVQGHDALEMPREEYFVEHSISTAAAKDAADKLRVEDVPVSREGCGSCSRREVAYCEHRIVEDHCCCERGFMPEPFPWLPHTCYLGPSACRPLAKDCARYARLRDCCCKHRLAAKWKSILSRSSRQSAVDTSLLIILAALLRCFLYLCNDKSH